MIADRVINVTPKGMGSLVAHQMAGESDEAFFAKFAEVCAALVTRWSGQGASLSEVRRFARDYAVGASQRRAELTRGQLQGFPEAKC